MPRLCREVPASQNEVDCCQVCVKLKTARNRALACGSDPDLRPRYGLHRSARIEERGSKEVVVETDDRVRTIDIHALRFTFGTQLSKAGVSLGTAQAAMWHIDPSLTANVCTDSRLLDVAGAINTLPKLPLGASVRASKVV